MNLILWLVFIAGGFLSGSIMFCKIIPKLLMREDICAISDDGNPGAFNVFKHCGKVMGTFCLLLDILKGFIPVFLASIFMNTGSALFTLVLLAPVLGHAVGTFNRFHGGKCIAVSFGVMLGLMPVTWVGLAVLAGLYILFSTAIKINPNRVRSIVVYSLFGVVTAVVFSIMGLGAVAAGCGFIALIAIVKHLNFASHNQERTYINEQ